MLPFSRAQIRLVYVHWTWSSPWPAIQCHQHEFTHNIGFRKINEVNFMKWSWKKFHEPAHWKLLKNFRSQKTTDFEQNLPSCWSCGRNKEIWINMFSLTLKSLSSFPASASSKVVFPELGGPSSNVNLQFHSNEFQQQPRDHQSAISLLPTKKDPQQIKLE
jgi:hypothetical protein